MALTDQVIMPGSDYQAICDATRTLTGKTATLKSGDISNELGTVLKQPETWIINEVPNFPSSDIHQKIPFITIAVSQVAGGSPLYNYPYKIFHIYSAGRIRFQTHNGFNPTAYMQKKWEDPCYRRVSFLNSPSGNLLAWLTDNAVKITDDESYSYNVQESLDYTVNGFSKKTVAPTPPYDSLRKVIVTTKTVEQAVPSIYVNTTTGEITSTVTQTEAGWVKEGTKTATQQLDTQAAKTVTPTEAEQIAVEIEKYTTGEVVVAAVPTTYVGSGISRKSSSDLTANGATVTAPAGYYENAASKSVATVTQATPSISVNSTGLITASATQSAGYVTAGTKSATQQLPVASATDVLNNVTLNFASLSGNKARIEVEFDSGTIGASGYSAGKFIKEDIVSVVDDSVTIPTEQITITPSWTVSSSSSSYDPTDGMLIRRVVVNKPSTLISSNIKKGVEIGGIAGTYTGEFVSLPFTKVTHLYVDNGIVSFTSDKLYHTLIVSNGVSDPTLMTAIIEATGGNNYAHTENSRGMYNTSSTALSVSYNSSTSTYSYTWRIANSSSNYMYEGNFDVYGR